jgi:phage shock protein A
MIKLMIREMEDTLVELKVACAGVIAGRRKAERRLDEVVARERLWADRAALAVRHGKDDLAREALVEKRRCTALAEALHREIVDHGGLIEQYQHDMVELEDKLATAKEKRNLLVERHRRAAGKKRAQEDIRRMDSSESMARFEKLESRIEQMEAEADLVNFGRKPAGDDRFDNLGRDDEIEQELAKIKAGTYSAGNTSAQ